MKGYASAVLAKLMIAVRERSVLVSRVVVPREEGLLRQEMFNIFGSTE